MRNFSASAAEYIFDYNERCRNAYREFMSLDMVAGEELIREELAHQPKNLAAVYVADYQDCLLLMLNGDPAEYRKREVHLDRRLALIEKGDRNSPWYRYCKAGMYLRWSLVYGRFGDNLKAAGAFRKAFLLSRENQHQHPDFSHNQILTGLGQAVAGTIPDDYKWVASLFGIKGNVRKGIGLIVNYLNEQPVNTGFREEAAIYYCYLKFYLLSGQEDVWNYLNSSGFSVENNLLNALVKINLAINYRQADVALHTLSSAGVAEAYRQFPIFDYEMGSALLLKLDPRGLPYLNRFIQNYKGKLFIKDSWQQLAFAYYLQDNMPKANYCRKQILQQGSAQTDADKQALRFAKTNSWPARPVLQARLLLDGGYHSRAMEKLLSCNVHSLPTVTDKLEYYFRLGRAYDLAGEEDKALDLYQKTILLGRDRKEHFAARSALQTALLYEKGGKLPEAIAAFKDCLSMKNHDFQANIDQQAKAGINRLTQR